MIKWCAYCQRYQGEVAPFERKLVSHGICESCLKVGLDWTPEQEERIRYLTSLSRKLWQAGIDADPSQMEALAREGFQSGLRPIDMLLGLAGPALVRVGELWATGELTVQDEHLFTETCEVFIALVSRQVCLPESEPAENSVLLANVSTNEHTLGLRFVRLGLFGMGIQSTIFGGDSSGYAVVEQALNGKHGVVGLSISLPEQMPQLRSMLRAFGAEPAFKGRILIGGAAVNQGLITLGELASCELVSCPRFDESERSMFALSKTAAG